MGSDVAMRSVAAIVDKFGLNGPSRLTVDILCDKSKFRDHLSATGLLSLKNVSINAETDWNLEKIRDIQFPIFVKPVDQVVERNFISKNPDELSVAIQYAKKYSLSNNIILESKIITQGLQICGDGFIKNGKVCFLGIGNNYFLPNSFAPFAEVFPPVEAPPMLEISNKLEKLLASVNYQNGPFNMDLALDQNKQCILLEVAPRLGGNFLYKAIDMSYGFNILKAYVDYIMGVNFEVELSDFSRYYLNVMLHRKLPKDKLAGKIDFGKWLPFYVNIEQEREVRFVNPAMSKFVGNVIFEIDNKDEVSAVIDYSMKNEIVE